MLHHRADFEREAEQGDKALRVLVVVKVACCEARDAFVVQAVLASRTGSANHSLVKVNFGPACDGLLCFVDKGHQRVKQSREPFSVVDKLGDLDGNLLLVVVCVAVKANVVHHAVGKVQNRSAGSLVNAAALHSNAAVFANVNQAHAVLSANLVQFFQERKRVHFLSVQGDGDSLFKVNLYELAFFGSLFGNGRVLEHVRIVGSVLSLLKLQAFVAKVPNVFVAAVGLVMLHRNFKLSVLKVLDFGLAAVHVPFGVAPSGDDLKVGSEGFDGKLKANLVVALSCGSVANRDGLFLARVLNQNFSDKRTGR